MCIRDRTNANKAFERLLSVVKNIIQKEVSKTHPTATILTTQDEARDVYKRQLLMWFNTDLKIAVLLRSALNFTQIRRAKAVCFLNAKNHLKSDVYKRQVQLPLR